MMVQVGCLGCAEFLNIIIVSIRQRDADVDSVQ